MHGKDTDVIDLDNNNLHVKYLYIFLYTQSRQSSFIFRRYTNTSVIWHVIPTDQDNELLANITESTILNCMWHLKELYKS